MLTDAAIKALKPKEKLYKVADRDGMCVAVQPSGAIVFRYDYRLNGRRETLTLGRYGSADLSLARAREKLIDAQRAILEGRSPAQEKQREKRRIKEAKSFGEFGERWLQEHRMAGLIDRVSCAPPRMARSRRSLSSVASSAPTPSSVESAAALARSHQW